MMPKASYTSSDGFDSEDSADDDFQHIFAGRTAKEIRARRQANWDPIFLGFLLSHAVKNVYSSKNLPSVDKFESLCAHAQVPTGYGRRVLERCLELLIDAIRNHVSESGTRGLIRESRQTGPSTWTVDIAKVLVDCPQTATITNIKNRTLENLHNTTGRVFLRVQNVSSMSKTSLVQVTMGRLLPQVSQRGAGHTVRDPSAAAAAATTLSAAGAALFNTASAAPMYIPIQDTTTTASGSVGDQQQGYARFLRYVTDVMTWMSEDESRVAPETFARLWEWNGQSVGWKSGNDYAAIWRAG